MSKEIIDTKPGFFVCTKCKNYCPVSELEEVYVKGFLFRKSFCKCCLEEIKSQKKVVTNDSKKIEGY